MTNASPYRITRFTAYETDRIALQATADTAGLMVISEMYYPGWRATVNGKPTVILRVDGGLRGIAVPQGQSRIGPSLRAFIPSHPNREDREA